MQKNNNKKIEKKILCGFCSCFKKVLLKIVFENTKNSKRMFFENSYLLFNLFIFMFFKKKKRNQTRFPYFSFIFLVFEKQKQFSKTINKSVLCLSSLNHLQFFLMKILIFKKLLKY